MAAASDVKAPKEAISIYAELLSNIRQVSVVVTLPSPSDSSTRVSLCENGQSLEITHKELPAGLALPAVVLPASGDLEIKLGSLDLSYRLPVSGSSPRQPPPPPESQLLPWSSVDIMPGSPIRCRRCGLEFVQKDKLKTWKDLPSENWAEMMEFWHCHKPHEHNSTDEDSLGKKGYGASNTIASQPNLGLVDQTSFLISETDCSGLLFSADTYDVGSFNHIAAAEKSPATNFLRVFCSGCKDEVGMFNIRSSSLTLFKWGVSVVGTDSSITPNPTSSECLAAILLASISRSGSAKSVVAPYSSGQGAEESGDMDKALNLWVLNSNVVYTSSSVDGRRIAMKVLYQCIDAEQGAQLVESLKSDYQDISFPQTAIVSAMQNLKASSLLLPIRERDFKEWSVGLLDRWDVSNSK